MKRIFLGWLSITLALSGVPLHAVTYTIAPQAYQTVLDNSGAIVSGACVWTYTAGTSTPATTYSDSSGTTNSNPIQADTSGRFVAYLAPGSAYKFVYEAACTPPAHGTTLKTVDNISAMGLGSVQANDIGNCEGRITLSSGVPVTTADVTAATTVYFTPYKGNQCSTYDSAAGTWSVTTFAEVSLSLGTDTTGKNYDLFGYSNGGAFTLERLVWTNDSTRATVLTTQDGVYVKSGQTSRRYLGTYRTTGAGTSEDSFAKRFVWNYYNRVPRAMKVLEATNTWSYNTNAFRIANNAATNELQFVVGVAECQVQAHVLAMASGNAADILVVAVGPDSVTVPDPTGLIQATTLANTGAITPVTALSMTYPAAGYHFYAWLEKDISAGGTIAWYGDNGGTAGSAVQSGIYGWIEG